MDEISRWYNVDVFYVGTTGKKYHINLPRTADFSEVIQALQAQGLHLFVFRKTITVFSH